MSSVLRSWFFLLAAPVLAICGLLLSAGAAPAGQPWWPGNRSPWPWEGRPKIHGYDENPPATPPPTNVTRAPARYIITITVLPQKAAKGDADAASIVAHLPEHALLWFGDYQTKQRGMLRHFVSPSLKPGSKYRYKARVAWFEDGHWVSQTKELPVAAGATSCLFLTKKSALAAALAGLPAEDRKLAERQRFCPVQPANQLGAMGVPVKVMLKGQPVFLCCKDCAEKARKEPDKTLAKAKELMAKNARTPPK